MDTRRALETEKLYDKIRNELFSAIKLKKCKKCGCMIYGLDDVIENLKIIENEIPDGLACKLSDEVKELKLELKPVEYSCLGCKHCYPASAANFIADAVIYLIQNGSKNNGNNHDSLDSWPVSPGEYSAFCDGEGCPVAVSTLASLDLYSELSKLKPKGLCIIGKTETENIGIDKIIKNTITNSTLHYLIVSGRESEGHYSGQTLISLYENSVDKNMRIIGSNGKKPILKNVTREEVEFFRKQVKVINMIGCEDAATIVLKISELLKDFKNSEPPEITDRIFSPPPIEKIIAEKPERIKLDKKGYFVIIPSFANKTITVEFYNYHNELLNVIEGGDVPSIYSTIVEKELISELTHAAYIGKELEKARWCMDYDIKYIQGEA